jgi:hydroxymethylglutaryl-CoA synthase
VSITVNRTGLLTRPGSRREAAIIAAGIAAYGSYVPFWRLPGATAAAALGRAASPGSRAVASYDQDTTTLAVEAARAALACAPAGARSAVDALAFATATPVYADKTNATAIHAALGLPSRVRASDAGGSTRGGIAALIAALRSRETTLVAMSDVNTGPAGSQAEAHGDAAAAFVAGESDDLVAEFLGAGSVSAQFGDRWRTPGEPWSTYWEERFGETIYARLGEESFAAAVKAAGIAPIDVTRLAVTGVSPRAAAQVARAIGVDRERVVDDLSQSVGFSGAAHPGLLVAGMLDVARPGDVIALVSLVDGSDTLLLRATTALAGRRSVPSVQAQVAAGNPALSYLDFLAWTGQVVKQMPRRPDPDRVAAPPASRRAAWKYGFQGSACRRCGTRHLPPQDVCLRCGAVHDMEPVPLADAMATIATYTIDHLAYSPSPPVVAAVLDFDGGGRYTCELTDVDADSVAIGGRVQMTFRRLSTAGGVVNYFWKARPVAGEPASKGS